MNKQRMLELAEHIESHMKEFNMMEWASPAECSTVCCIAGHAVAKFQPTDFVNWLKIYNYKSSERRNSAEYTAYSIFSFKHRGMEILDLTEEEAGHLFIGDPIETDIETIAEGWELRELNEYRKHIPNALRWMANNNEINWNKALKAVGAL